LFSVIIVIIVILANKNSAGQLDMETYCWMPLNSKPYFNH